MGDAREVDAMSVEDLKAEVWYWRENAAAELAFTVVYFENRDLKMPFRTRADLERRVRNLAVLLNAALAGDYFERCGVCGEPVKPGQALIRDVEMSDCHAACMGDPEIAREGGVQPGDVVLVDPESVVGPDDEPLPDSDGRLVSYGAERLYTTAQIAEKTGRAFALLAGPKAV